MLACPFCLHEETSFAEFSQGRKVMHAIQCANCNAVGPMGNTREQALVGWHMRDGEAYEIDAAPSQPNNSATFSSEV